MLLARKKIPLAMGRYIPSEPADITKECPRAFYQHQEVWLFDERELADHELSSVTVGMEEDRDSLIMRPRRLRFDLSTAGPRRDLQLMMRGSWKSLRDSMYRATVGFVSISAKL